ncbi:multiple cyclophane-containing RiPP AmcA [Streptomyces lunalinharesii]|uniref:Uncharacterized protein n=1 Tax=Streptomyces lunalinharesii TaxID=333384 RepID=A0ABN3SED9_9ACTN
MSANTAIDIVLASAPGFQSLLEAAKTEPTTLFDNRPTWDNQGSAFDNRPTWDNWNKK